MLAELPLIPIYHYASIEPGLAEGPGLGRQHQEQASHPLAQPGRVTVAGAAAAAAAPPRPSGAPAMSGYLVRRLVISVPTLADHRHDRVLHDARGARRTVRSGARPAARDRAQHAGGVQSRRAAGRAVLGLPEGRRPRRLRAVLQIPGLHRRGAAAAGLPGEPQGRRHRDRARRGDRHHARHDRGAAPEQRHRLRRDGDRHDRHHDPQLRHGAALDPGPGGPSRLAAGRRLGRRRAEVPDPAGDRARPAADRLCRAPHPRQHDRDPERQLRPHGARQGSARADRGGAPRAQGRAPAGRLLSRPGDRPDHDRLGRDRDDLRHPGHRPLLRAGCFEPRLHPGDGHGDRLRAC